MKKVFTKLMAIAIATTVLVGCQKQPEASFTTDKTSYIAGETVKLTNTTVNGDSYKWTFPDGQTGTVENYDYSLPTTLSDGSLTFKLEAFSKNKKKVNEISKTVTVKAATGNVVFWQETGSGYGATVVQVNGITSNITSEYGSAPDCSASGCAVFNALKVGAYNYTATDGNANWSGTINITKNTCLTFQLR